MRSLLGPVLLLLAASTASGRTWNVYADGSGDAPTIQAAADSSAPGDTLLIGPGTYAEAVTLPHDLTLSGVSGAEATSVSAGGIRNSCVGAAGTVTRLVLEGLTFENTFSDEYAGCHAAAVRVQGDVEVRNCRFLDNQAYDSGSALVGTGNLIVTGCEFRGNFAYTGGSYCSPYPDAGCGVSCINLWSGTLAVENCLFEENSCRVMSASGAEIVGCVFRRNLGEYNPLDATFFVGHPDLLEGNLFVENRGPLFDLSFDCGGSAPGLRIVGNTFARNPDFFVDCPVPDGSTVERNVFTGSRVGLAVPEQHAAVQVECNDSWGNDVNWGGADLEGVLGNFSAPPLYCNAPGEDFSVAANSPLLPANNSCGVVIGAFGPGCLPLAIEPSSWGRIKASYRSAR